MISVDLSQIPFTPPPEVTSAIPTVPTVQELQRAIQAGQIPQLIEQRLLAPARKTVEQRAMALRRNPAAAALLGVGLLVFIPVFARGFLEVRKRQIPLVEKIPTREILPTLFRRQKPRTQRKIARRR